jgi:hypothetical protein
MPISDTMLSSRPKEQPIPFQFPQFAQDMSAAGFFRLPDRL